MAKVSLTFAAWKEGRVAPGTGEVRVIDAPKEAKVVGRAPPNRGTTVNNLKQIGLAFHNYHSTYRTFAPAAIHSKDGKPLLSWRVALLPYLEQDALYREFKLDEPWDSEHNKKLLAKMPAVFATPGVDLKEPGLTLYQVFTGPGTIFDSPKGTRLAQIPDGTSNTILAVEAGEPVPWTKPADLVYDAKKPLPKLGGADSAGFHILMADGSVRMIPQNIQERVLRALITRDDGMVIQREDLEPPKK